MIISYWLKMYPLKNHLRVQREYISQGVSSLKQGQVEDAITKFNRAIDLDPGKAVAYAARGSAYFRLEKLDNAISDYNKAIEINPES